MVGECLNPHGVRGRGTQKYIHLSGERSRHCVSASLGKTAAKPNHKLRKNQRFIHPHRGDVTEQPPLNICSKMYLYFVRVCANKTRGKMRQERKLRDPAAPQGMFANARASSSAEDFKKKPSETLVLFKAPALCFVGNSRRSVSCRSATKIGYF